AVLGPRPGRTGPPALRPRRRSRRAREPGRHRVGGRGGGAPAPGAGRGRRPRRPARPVGALALGARRVQGPATGGPSKASTVVKDPTGPRRSRVGRRTGWPRASTATTANGAGTPNRALSSGSRVM